jgi:hypothetical protein
MSVSRLVVASERQSASEKLERLKAEARGLAHEHLETLNEALAEVAQLSREICEGGDLYPVGAQELARRLKEDAARHALALSGIIARH